MKDRLIDGYIDYLSHWEYFDNYVRLLNYMNEVPFVWKREMDANQIKHAEEFRDKIARTHFIKYNHFQPPTVLEVLLALAERFSEVIFVPGDEQAEGFYDIFTLFLENLGLNIYDDDNFNEDEVSRIINNWMCLKYNRDGTGGNIVVKPGYNKLKSLDIWMQLNKVFVPVLDNDISFPVNHPYVE